ncbi:ATP-binding protein, partial [bacterium]|nr:ATP-binding protein [bacterium]
MPEFTPRVNEAQEFLEISSDFGDPKEIVREAISNSYDAGATEIEIKAVIDKSRGEDELVITISDNGEGMSIKEVENFFGLGYTNRVKKDALGKKISDAIGEKGHGTIIYFNSQSIEVTTIKDGKRIVANLKEPKKNLKLGKIPPVKYSERKIAKLGNGTKVTVRGYNDNNQGGFGHDEIKDYIFWKTRFGSFEKEIGKDRKSNVAIKLAGIGWQDTEAEGLKFGHPFPKVITNLRELKKKDKVSPLDYYSAKWSFRRIQVIDFPSATLDFVFYIEGDKAKRAYNNMIHEPHAAWKSGQYNVQDRYGLWLTKDYIPIERRNTWVAEKTEWTK